LLFALLGLPLVQGSLRGCESRVLCAIMLGMGLLWGLSFDGWWTWSGSDYWLKYGLAALTLVMASRIGVGSRGVAWGMALGGAGALAAAAYDYLVLRLDKAWGFTNAIQFGGIAMYLGIATWAVALFGGWRLRTAAALWALGACGVLASLLAESRGSWVVAPLLVAAMLWLMWQHGKKALALRALAGTVVLVAIMVVPAAHKFGSRAELAVQEFALYQSNPQQAAVTSIGQRLEQWKLAVHLGLERPWTGWGLQGFAAQKQVMVAQGLAHPSVLEYGHAHNEILDMWAKRGLVGVAVLLLFYAIPLWAFWPTVKRLQRVPPARQAELLAMRVAGALLPIAYFGFGWTQVFFAHNSGNLFYLFSIVALWGAVCRLQQTAEAAAQ